MCQAGGVTRSDDVTALRRLKGFRIAWIRLKLVESVAAVVDMIERCSSLFGFSDDVERAEVKFTRAGGLDRTLDTTIWLYKCWPRRPTSIACSARSPIALAATSSAARSLPRRASSNSPATTR